MPVRFGASPKHIKAGKIHIPKKKKKTENNKLQLRLLPFRRNICCTFQIDCANVKRALAK